jgi:hypothetical protein
VHDNNQVCSKCVAIGAQDNNVSYAPILSQQTPVLQGMSVPGSNRVGTQDSRYPAMSALYTQHYLQDSNLASGEEQGTSR